MDEGGRGVLQRRRWERREIGDLPLGATWSLHGWRSSGGGGRSGQGAGNKPASHRQRSGRRKRRTRLIGEHGRSASYYCFYPAPPRTLRFPGPICTRPCAVACASRASPLFSTRALQKKPSSIRIASSRNSHRKQARFIHTSLTGEENYWNHILDDDLHPRRANERRPHCP